MAKIEVRITKNAEKDLMLIYEYILNDLKSPQTALKYFNQLASSINSLNLFPERCPIVKEFIKLGIKIRRLNVNNHAIFYKYENHIVTILRVFHAIKLNNSNFWIDSAYLEIGVICMFCTKFSFQVLVAMLQSCCL